MNMLTCAACGGNELIDQGTYYVCAYCGTKYEKEKETRGASSFDRASEIESMLKRADIYWRRGNIPRAKQLYRQILELDASCEIARARFNGR